MFFFLIKNVIWINDIVTIVIGTQESFFSEGFNFSTGSGTITVVPFEWTGTFS